MVDKSNEHYQLGKEHAFAGYPKYKFQDPYLQKLYDEGYNDTCAKADRDLEELRREELKFLVRRQQKW
jgi:hypothetical protein